MVSAISFAILFAYAETEKQTAQRTLQGFEDAIGIINPESGQGSRDMSVEEYIQSVEEHVEANLGTQPRIASALLTTLGLIELAFRNTDRSRELLERALALQGEAGPAALGESWHATSGDSAPCARTSPRPCSPTSAASTCGAPPTGRCTPTWR